MSAFSGFPSSISLFHQAIGVNPFIHLENEMVLEPEHYKTLQHFLFFKNYISKSTQQELLLAGDPALLFRTTCDALYEMLRVNGFAVGVRYKELDSDECLQSLAPWYKLGFLMERKTIKALQQFLASVRDAEKVLPNEADNGLFGESTIKALTSFCILVKQGDSKGETARDSVSSQPDELMRAIPSISVPVSPSASCNTGDTSDEGELEGSSVSSSVHSSKSTSSISSDNSMIARVRNPVQRPEGGDLGDNMCDMSPSTTARSIDSSAANKGSTPMSPKRDLAGGARRTATAIIAWERGRSIVTSRPEPPKGHRALLEQPW